MEVTGLRGSCKDEKKVKQFFVNFLSSPFFHFSLSLSLSLSLSFFLSLFLSCLSAFSTSLLLGTSLCRLLMTSFVYFFSWDHFQRDLLSHDLSNSFYVSLKHSLSLSLSRFLRAMVSHWLLLFLAGSLLLVPQKRSWRRHKNLKLKTFWRDIKNWGQRRQKIVFGIWLHQSGIRWWLEIGRTLTIGEVSLYGWPPVWLVWIWPNKQSWC